MATQTQLENIMLGSRYSRLVVIETLNKKWGKLLVRVKCDCGTEKTVYLYDMQREKVKSCGCLNRELSKERATKHGMKGTKIYGTWTNIKSRCLNKNDASYHNYGGRGISICSRWDDFQNFYDDMGDVPDGKSIDRIDNNGNYTPDNCRWATSQQQAENKRMYKANKLGITGVYYDEIVNRFTSVIHKYGKQDRVYYGNDFFEACCARKSAEINLT